MIGVTTEQFDRAVLILQEIPRGVERALSGAINRGLSTAKTTTSKEVRSIYHIRQGDLYRNVKTEKASVSTPIGAITIAGTVIPLYQFNVKDVNEKTEGYVAAAVLKLTNPKELRGTGKHSAAFVATMKSGHEGLWQRELGSRTSSGNERLKELFGPSVAHMAKNPQVVDTVISATQKMIDERLEHEYFRLLSRYGV